MGVCKRCGRELKNQHSIDLGYGPTCYKKEFPKVEVNTVNLEDFGLF